MVGLSILTATWHMLQNAELYRDLGGDYFARQNPDRLTRRLFRQLEALECDWSFREGFATPGRLSS